MKKPFILFALGLSAIPFSFYELEGPFGVHPREFNIKLLDNESILIGRFGSWGETNAHCSLCLYSSETRYSIWYWAPKVPSYYDKIISFFQGQKKPDELNNELYNFFLESYPYVKFKKDDIQLKCAFIKQDPNLVLDRLTDLSKLKGEELYYRVFFEYVPWEAVIISSTFSVLRVIKIENRDDKVFICKDNNKLSFEKALKNWFSDGKELEYIANGVIKSKQTPKNTESNKNNDPLFKNSDELPNLWDKFKRGVVLDKKASDLLNNSKILGVYGVFKGDDDKNSIVWGLAEDTTDPNKRRFHWITDLKGDISELIK